MHQNEYCNFLNIANGSAAEARYLTDVSARLGYVVPDAAETLERDYRELCAGLTALINAVKDRGRT